MRIESKLEGSLDLDAYAGDWMAALWTDEIYQRKCGSMLARYEVLGPNEVSVYNVCYDEQGNQVRDIRGKAKTYDAWTLIVDFGYFRKGYYNILDIDDDYRWALVVSDDDTFWLLVRPDYQISPEQAQEILNKNDIAVKNGKLGRRKVVADPDRFNV